MELGAVEKGDEQQTVRNRKASVMQLIQRQCKTLENVRLTRTVQFLQATAQLCHMDTALAERVWLDLFPRIWNIFSEKQQSVSLCLIPTISLSCQIPTISLVFMSDPHHLTCIYVRSPPSHLYLCQIPTISLLFMSDPHHLTCIYV